MRQIKSLSDKIISQIAAGEIIENPASVCKELIENAIDAKADKISIQLGDELIDSIRITDNGEGISKEDIPLAFKRHATSKLSELSDLDSIRSLGFRGEALASIANISQIEIISKTDDATFAYKAELIDGEISKFNSIGAPRGTSILIKNLFYNTPVRKKYLKSLKRELDSIIETIETIALSQSQVSIHVSYKSKTLLHSHASNNKINHIFSILGKEIANNLIPINFESESYKIEGFISNNTLHRSNAEKEFLFINGRSVKNKEISKKIRSMYHTIIPLQRYPVFILYINVDPILVDVNIHPQKQYVRLSNENYLVKILEKVIGPKLSLNKKIPPVSLNEEVKEKESKLKSVFDLPIVPIPDNFLRQDLNITKSDIEESEVGFSEDLDLDLEGVHNRNKDSLNGDFLKEDSLSYSKILDYDTDTKDEFLLSFEQIDFVGIVFKTYIIFENKEDSSILYMDQHAAHERILFEKFYRELKDESIHRQILLEPYVIQLSPNERTKMSIHRETFDSLGFTLEPFGGNSYVLREVPSTTLIGNYEHFIRDCLFELNDNKGIVEQNIYKVMRMACRQAIKGGDRIDGLEAMNLLKDLFLCHNPYSCPHGRPTIISMTKSKLEKMFLREG